MFNIKQGELRKCFVCSANVNNKDFNPFNNNNDNKNNWLCKRFCTLICRYLKINSRDPCTRNYWEIEKTLREGKFETSERDFNICGNCQPELDMFCRNYVEFYKLQLKLNWSVGRIKKLMNGNRKNGAIPGRKGFMGPSRERELENFKTTICNHAKAKCKRIPQVGIKKLDKKEIAKIRTKLATNSSCKSHVPNHDPIPGPSRMEMGFSDDDDDFGGGTFDHDPLASDDNDDDEQPRSQNVTIHENSVREKAATSILKSKPLSGHEPQPPKENGISVNIGNSNVISCKVCNKIFHHGVSLRIHLRLVHKMTDLDQIENQEDSTTTTNSNVARPSSRASSSPSFDNDFGPGPVSEPESDAEGNEADPDPTPTPKPKPLLKCRFCPNEFKTPQSRFLHERIHKTEKSKIDKESKPKSAQPENKSKPSKNKNKCRFCEQEFRTPQSRFLHERVHKTEKSNKSLLKEKELQGQIEKPEVQTSSNANGPTNANQINCDLCGKTFHHRGSWRIHRRLVHKLTDVDQIGSQSQNNSSNEGHGDGHHHENQEDSTSTTKSNSNVARPSSRGSSRSRSSFGNAHDDDFGAGPISEPESDPEENEAEPEPEPAPKLKPLLKCRYCPNEFKTPQSRFLHERVHKTEKPQGQIEKPETQTTSSNNASEPANANQIDCDLCGKTFHHGGSWRIHRRLVHKMTDVALNQDFKSATGTTENGISTGIEPEQGDLSYQCQFCDRKFRFPQTKFLHERSHKRNQKQVEKKNYVEPKPTNQANGPVSGRFTCHVCNIKFRTGHILSKHLRTIHPGASAAPAGTSTSLTSSKFNKKTRGRKKSMTTSKGKGQFKCQFCERTFNYKQNLNVHVRTHTGEKPFECGICGEKFRYNEDCKRHLKLTHKVKNGQGHIISHLKKGSRRSTNDENGDEAEVKVQPKLPAEVGKVKRRPGRPPKKIHQETENSAAEGENSLEEPPRLRIVVKTESDALPDPDAAEPVLEPELQMEQDQTEPEQNKDDHDANDEAMDSIPDPLTTDNPLSEPEDVTVNKDTVTTFEVGENNPNGHENENDDVTVTELATVSTCNVNPNAEAVNNTDGESNLNFNLELLEQNQENTEHSEIN